MCGRYVLRTTGEDLQALLPGLAVPADLAPRYNIAPTQRSAVVPNDGGRHVELFRWGLVPPWAKDLSIGNRLINARSETAAEKPSFRQALRRRRCLVLADGFYEWKKEGDGGKAPYWIGLSTGAPFAFAGLWESWRDPAGPADARLLTFTILTRAAPELLAPIHARMPVILADGAREHWVDPAPRGPEELLPLLAAEPPGDLTAHRVSRFVNDVKNDAPACVEPVEPGS